MILSCVGLKFLIYMFKKWLSRLVIRFFNILIVWCCYLGRELLFVWFMVCGVEDVLVGIICNLEIGKIVVGIDIMLVELLGYVMEL